MPDNLRLLQLHHHQLLSYAEPENQRRLSASQAAAQPGAASAGWRYLVEGGGRATVQLLIHCIQPVQEGAVGSSEEVLGGSEEVLGGSEEVLRGSEEVLGGTDALCLNLEATLTSGAEVKRGYVVYFKPNREYYPRWLIQE